MLCWLLDVFQGRRAIFDHGGGRESYSVQAGGCSVTNLLAVSGDKETNLHSLFFFSADISMNYGTSYFNKHPLENLTPWRVACSSEP